MSIRDRLDDARVLLTQGRRDGALLSVLVAVAATSRRRYVDAQKHQDVDAFVRFLLDENPVLFQLSDWIPTCEDDYIRATKPKHSLHSAGQRVGGLWCKVPGSSKWQWPDEVMPLAMILYKCVRNSLAHEGIVSSNVEFVESEPGTLVFNVLPDRLQLSNALMDALCRTVTFAPENFDLFPDIAITPPDVISWTLFGDGRDKRSAYMQARALRIQSVSGFQQP